MPRTVRHKASEGAAGSTGRKRACPASAAPFMLFFLLAGLWLGPARGSVVAPEYQVKAAFLFKFANYIRWPGSAKAQGPFVIGILGENPFGGALSDLIRGETVQGQRVEVRHLTRPEEALHCQVLFVSASERASLSEILAKVRGAPILTVGDMERFAEMGGMINLVMTADHHVHFDINRTALERAGLRAPSQLLELARIVAGPATGGG